MMDPKDRLVKLFPDKIDGDYVVLYDDGEKRIVIKTDILASKYKDILTNVKIPDEQVLEKLITKKFTKFLKTYDPGYAHYFALWKQEKLNK